MAMRITDDCVECSACINACPCDAIALDPVAGARVAIEPLDCSHCWPFHQRPQCVQVCPVHCIFVDPTHPVPPLPLIRRLLELILMVNGPRITAKLIVRMRGWLHNWFRVAIHVGTDVVAVDEILDFYNGLRLIEAEYAPVGEASPACHRDSGPAIGAPRVPACASGVGIRGRAR